MGGTRRTAGARSTPSLGPADPHALRLGVEGDGVSPESFEVLPTIAFVHAFVLVLEALAEGRRLQLTGLRVVPGSTAFCFEAPEPDHAWIRSMTSDTQRFMHHEHEAPRGARSRLADLKAAVGHLPPSYRPFFQAQGQDRTFIPREFEKPAAYRETTTMRMTVLGAGGKTPRVRVSTDSLPLLPLRANRTLTQRAGAALYKDIEAVVTLVWEGDAVIDAELHDFDVIEDMDPQEEIRRWNAWLADVGREWEDVDDIDRELGRGGDV
jgi:hypothetical protein